jgi:hypothetical protein
MAPIPEGTVEKHIWTVTVPNQAGLDKRATDRRPMTLPARLTWKDQHGTTRFASVVTRDVSEFGAYVECQSAVSIPLFRLVQFQLERDSREAVGLPTSLRSGRILTAVYRVSPGSTSGRPQCLALRLMVEPRRRAAAQSAEPAQAAAADRATA